IDCAFPWDIDSDPEDDEARIVLSGASVIDQGLDDMYTGALAALLVIGVYAGLAWMVSNYRERERLMAITRAAIEEKVAQKGDETKDTLEETREGGTEEEAGSEHSDSEEGVGLDQGSEEEEIDEFEMRLRRILNRE
ncbi:MAG: hypothetical protein NZ935_09320, partial [Planctomycetes bacterium]|nr:hypothetical protein [Planctomycetota bacterium]